MSDFNRRCVEQVHDEGRSVSFHQCYRKAGYGPDEQRCKQHAEKFAVANDVCFSVSIGWIGNNSIRKLGLDLIHMV